MSPPSSGKHTPAEATGDFAEFLQAEQLKEKLAKEQEDLVKRELKAAKKANKSRGDIGKLDGGGHGIGGRGKPETPEERWRRRHEVQAGAGGTDDGQGDTFIPTPTLEERKHFPGDLMHHGHLQNKSTTNKRLSTQPVNHVSPGNSPIQRTEKLRPLELDGEDEPKKAKKGASEDKSASHRLPASHSTSSSMLFSRLSNDVRRKSSDTARARRDSERKYSTASNESVSGFMSDEHAAMGNEVAIEDEEEGEGEADTAADGDDDDGDRSSVDSYASSNIVSPHEELSASIVSLKSFESDRSHGAGSYASGGANPKLARPLLELEELELDSFLKNFGRHTREIRVPPSANFPQRRMPRWEDFRVPRGEAALAAAQGKRVTVLTHVDRGLKALEEAAGEGVPQARGAETDKSGAEGKKSEGIAVGGSKAHVDGEGSGKDASKAHHGHSLFHRKDKKKAQQGGSADADRPMPLDEQHRTASSTTHLSGQNGTSNEKAALLKTGKEEDTESPASAKGVQVGSSSGLHARVSWADTADSFDRATSDKAKSQTAAATDYAVKQRPHSPEIGSSSPFARFRKGRYSADKDEAEAKRQERAHLQSGVPAVSKLAEQSGPMDIHDERVEWRPSRDEANLNEEEWEILHGVDEEDMIEANEVEKLVHEDDDDRVDGIAWAIAYILAAIERYAPEELDNSPDQTYRESRTRSHVERLYLIAPFWEWFLFGIRRVYRWDDPRRTSSFAMIYFTLWYLDLIPTAFLLTVMFYVCRFRFFPPSASYLHEQVRRRMARGVDADRLAERLRRRSRLDVLELYKRFVVAYGAETQLAAGDIADFHEKVKNLILWRNPTATWRTLLLLGISCVFVTFASPHLVWKTVFAFIGFSFFILLPLQSHYPRFRRPLSPIWWALWGSPTDAQFAIQLLRRRHLERQHAKHPPTSAGAAKRSNTDDVLYTSTSGETPAALHDYVNQITKAGAGGSSAMKKVNRSPSDTSEGSGLKGKFMRHSSAAQAVAYGALRPFRTGSENRKVGVGGRSMSDENLLDLQDVKVLEGGQVMAKPRKLGSFFCQHHGVPGHLHVTTRMLYFVALHSYATNATQGSKGGRKTCKTALSEISGLVKTKSIKLVVWNSSGLQITRRNKSSLFFSNMPHRDNAFNLLLAIGSEVWHKHI